MQMPTINTRKLINSKLAPLLFLLLWVTACSIEVTVETNESAAPSLEEGSTSPSATVSPVTSEPVVEPTTSPTPALKATPTLTKESIEVAVTPIQFSSTLAQQPRACMLTGLSDSFICITSDGNWREYDENSLPNDQRSPTDFTFCNDGRLVIEIDSQLFIEDIGGWVALPQLPGTNSVVEGAGSIGCTDPGNVWVTHKDKLLQLKEDGWAQVTGPFADNDDVRFGPLHISPDGDIWLLEHRFETPRFSFFTFSPTVAILHFDKTNWTRHLVADLPQSQFDIQPIIDRGPDIYQGGLTKDHFLHFYENRLLFNLDPEGNPYLISDYQLIWRENGDWVAQSDPTLWNMRLFMPDGLGNISGAYFPTNGINPDKTFFDGGPDFNGLGLFKIDGTDFERFTTENSEISSEEIRHISADTQGRIWIGTNYGLNIFSQSDIPFNGDKWVNYYSDNAPLPGHTIDKVLVFGDGPSLPEPIQNENRRGSVSGTIFLNDQPASEVKVELCSEQIWLEPAETPLESCESQRNNRAIQTDTEGRFTVEDLPIGVYFIHVVVDGEWASLPNSPWWSYAPIETVQVSIDTHEDVGLLSIVPRIKFAPPEPSTDQSTEPDPQNESAIYNGGSRVCMLLESQETPIACINNDQEWITYTSDDFPLSSGPIQYDICGDGRMLIRNFSGLFLESEGEWLPIETAAESISAGILHCSQTGHIWHTDNENNLWFALIPTSADQDLSRWQSFSLAQIFPSADAEMSFPLVQLRFSDEGRTVFAFSFRLNAVSVLEGDQWSPIPIEEDLPFGIQELAVDSLGVPFALSGNTIYQYVDSNWIEVIESPTRYFSARLAFTSNGDLILYGDGSADEDGIFIVDRDLGTFRQFDSQNNDVDGQLSINEINQLVTDLANRVWIGTSWGLNVIDENGNVITYQMHTSPLPDNEIKQIKVHGADLTLPQTIQVENGSIRGFIFLEDQPMADATISLCVGYATVGFSNPEEDPCINQPFQQSQSTNIGGEFYFEDLPQGNYRLFVEREGKWTRIGKLNRFNVTAGLESDVGVISVSPEDFE